VEQVSQQRVGRIPIRVPYLLGGAVTIVWLVALFLWGSGDALAWGVAMLPQGVGLLAALLLLQIVPGLALLRLLWPADLAPLERFGLAWCVGIGLPPLLLQTAYLIGLPWNGWTTGVYVGVALVTLLWPYLRNHRLPEIQWRMSIHALLFGVLLAIGFLLRLYLVRDLPVGLWGDSYQHTMMAQLLVDNRGLFTSWQPYVPLATFTYHFGFHANAAFLHWITGLSVPRSVLIVGQLLSTATLPAAYLLTRRLTGNRAAGLWALLLTGFVNNQPIFYVNWGRYTQLAGQLVLVWVVLAWIALLDRDRIDWRAIVFAALGTASLMLTHYVVTIFAAVLLLAYVAADQLRVPSWRRLQSLIVRGALGSGLAIVIALPWLLNTLRGHLSRNVGGFVSGSVPADRVALETALGPLAPDYIRTSILILALIGLGWALARRNWRAALFAVWSALLVLLIVPHVVGLPGRGVISWLTGYIALYITVIPLAAYGIAQAQFAIMHWRRDVGIVLATAAIALVSVWGVRWQADLIDTQFQLFMPADNEAMEWIRSNTPPDARIAVNMFPAYGGTLFAGADGGWWIPLLTQRQTTLPPLTYGSERAESPEYYRRINEFGYALRDHPLPSDEGVALLRNAGIGYVYSGANHTRDDLFDVDALRQHPAFSVVYDRDGVVIFALNP
jgi:hypothetical protein